MNNIFFFKTELYNLRDGTTFYHRNNMEKIKDKTWTLLTLK